MSMQALAALPPADETTLRPPRPVDAPRHEGGAGRRRDERLVRRMAAGDEEALGDLYARHASVLLAFLRARYGLGDEAEEVVQETFLQAWSQADRYDPAAATPRGWLFVLARSRALDRLRSTVARVRREQAFYVGLAECEPVGTAGLEARERRARVRRALRSLPGKQQRCVALAFFGELSHRQVADRLQQPLGTVKSRIFLGLKRMRRELSRAA